MKEIVIGRDGNQPFKITAEGVSAHHARLTIQDNGKWLLTDLGSRNGTYVFNQHTHQFDLIEVKIIDENSLIRLGPDDTIRCYQFIARQLVKENQEDFSVEFQELQRKWHDIQNKKEQLERQITRKAFLPVGLSLVLMGLTCGLPESWSADARINAIRAVMLVPSLLSPYLNSSGRKQQKKLNEEIKEMLVCPNPDCGLPLSESEIRKGRCAKCKKHI